MNDGFDIGQSLEDGVSRIFEYIPQIIGAVIILLIGYIIAKVLKKVVRRVLTQVRFDRSLHTSPAGKYINKVIDSPAALVAKIVFWFVFIGFISLAVSVLNIEPLTDFVAAIYGYLPNVIAALLIFMVASAISGGAAAFVQKVMGNTPTAKVLKTAIPAITMSIAIFMILNQLQIATEIVNITYTAIMGALALGIGLAFGLGGRDIASRMLENAYDSAQRNAGTVRRDMNIAKENTKREVNHRRGEV